MKERHAQILEAIKSFYQENGFCPTVRQIGDMVGLKSTSTVIKLKRKTPVLNRFSYCMDSGLPAMMPEWMSLQSLRILNISGRE